ncbi:uncharacterized protein Dwil_GK22235 [Drosophila willistoni]|uniref:MORN repeat-containing protein 3 n=1 Tax=Drosophila willistoni TaxID=7260 RepID=B4MYJ2_DROWI|nr:MORN repeat-containing protein 3 isoform X1 [Drosophila willistoni]EDW77181.1 uncharacterized protein Dwil_GK22235 [Drosophila willistoni]
MSCHTSGSVASGVRCLRYPGGAARYEGKWLNNQHHGFGVKANKHGLIYEGQWSKGQRHGYGTLRRQRKSSQICERIYVGQWHSDKRCGEGKQFYDDGSIYFGQWHLNQRHGRGIQWYSDGRIYIGEWQQDAMHGKGVLFSANGNRYVGEFEKGCKSGSGLYYHLDSSGQRVQLGNWMGDICKSSLMPLQKQTNIK